MTNEEAREVINREIDKAIDDETYMTDEVYDALCVASKSIALQILESQPCEDCIKGKWIILDECANEGVYCSECHKKVFKLEFSPTMKWRNFKYCPNCGAKMEGDYEED